MLLACGTCLQEDQPTQGNQKIIQANKEETRV
jgi:hypothetical protein